MNIDQLLGGLRPECAQAFFQAYREFCESTGRRLKDPRSRDAFILSMLERPASVRPSPASGDEHSWMVDHQPAPALALPGHQPRSAGKFLNNYAAASLETGLSEWTLRAIKRASRGQPDSPFSGRLTTAARLSRWLESHPDFVPTSILVGQGGHGNDSHPGPGRGARHGGGPE